MATATSTKLTPPTPPTTEDAALCSFETAVRMAAMPSPLDKATAIAHAAATVAACEAAAAALRDALSDVEAAIEQASRREIDTSRVAAAAAEYARASAERVSAQAVAETLCPDAIEAARLGSPKDSSAARGLSARVKLLRRMAQATYKSRPEARLEAAKAAFETAIAALSVYEKNLVATLPKSEPALTEHHAELYRYAVHVRSAALAGDACPPQGKERAAAAQAKLDAAPDADAKAAAVRATVTLPTEEAAAAEQAKSRERLCRSGAMLVERGRLQLAISSAVKEVEAAKQAMARAAVMRMDAESGLAAAQTELDSLLGDGPDSAAAAATGAPHSPSSTGTDEDPSAASWGAGAARARFNAAVEAEAAALAVLGRVQAGGGTGGGTTLESLRASQRALQAKIDRIEGLAMSAQAAASGVS